MDKKAYIIAKSSAESYTDQALDGVGALKGDPCQIDSITPSPDGTGLIGERSSPQSLRMMWTRGWYLCIE